MAKYENALEGNAFVPVFIAGIDESPLVDGVCTSPEESLFLQMIHGTNKD